MYSVSEKRRAEKIAQKTIKSHAKCCYTGRIPGGYCTCFQMASWLLALLKTRIPVEYWGLGSYKLGLLEQIDEYFESEDHVDDGFGFYIFGDYGVGKTTTLAEIGKRFLMQGKQVVWFLLQEFVDTIYEGFHEKDLDELDENNELMILSDRIKDADVLLIDEFDKAYIKKGSDFVLRQTETFIRKKLMGNCPVFIASNTKMNELKNIFGSESLQVAIGRKLDEVQLIDKLNFDERLKFSEILSSKATKKESEMYHVTYRKRYSK